MAKKKSSKSRKPSRQSRRSSRARSSVGASSSKVKYKGFSFAKLFLDLLFIIVIILGIYVIWTRSWSEGIGIIVAALIVYLIIKLISNIRKRK